MEIGDPGEGCCVWEVEVGKSHFGGMVGWYVCEIVSYCILWLWRVSCVFHGVGRLRRSFELRAPIRFDKWRTSILRLQMLLRMSVKVEKAAVNDISRLRFSNYNLNLVFGWLVSLLIHHASMLRVCRSMQYPVQSIKTKAILQAWHLKKNEPFR